MIHFDRYFVLAAAMAGSLLAGCSSDPASTTPAPLNVTGPAIYVVNGGSSSVSVIDTRSDSVIGEIELTGMSWPHHIDRSRDGSKLIVGVPGIDLSAGHSTHGGHATPGAIVVINSVTGAIERTIATESMNHNAAITHDGTEIWTALMEKNRIDIYDATTGAAKSSITVDSMPLDVQFSNDGRWAYVACGEASSIAVIDVAKKEATKRLTVGKGPIAPWVSSNGSVYVTSEEEPSFTVIDQITNTAGPVVGLPFTPGSAAVRPGDATRLLWIADETKGAVQLYENETTAAGEIACRSGAHALAFTEDGTKLYVTNQGAGTVSVIDVSTRKVIKTITVGSKPNGILFRAAR